MTSFIKLTAEQLELFKHAAPLRGGRETVQMMWHQLGQHPVPNLKITEDPTGAYIGPTDSPTLYYEYRTEAFVPDVQSALQTLIRANPVRIGQDPTDPEVFIRTNADGSTERGQLSACGVFISSQPVAQAPLTETQVQSLIDTKHFRPGYKLTASDQVCLNWYRLGLRDGEEAHGLALAGMNSPLSSELNAAVKHTPS